MALTGDDIGLEQQKIIKNVQDLTEVESHVARQLLQEMRWNYEAVAELYFEDAEKLLAKAGIVVAEAAVDKRAQGSESGLHLETDGSFTCQVCYDTFEGEEVAANVRVFPSCGHAMCKGCWFQQLKTQIIEEGVSARISCPGFSMVDGRVVRCNIILDELFVGNLLKEVELAQEEPDAQRTRARYHKQLNFNYVNNNQCIKWCPATDCTSAVRIKDSFDKNSYCTDVVCSNGHKWCFNCTDEPHAPADCSQVKDWRKKCVEDKASVSWLMQFTKECPKCKITINKDGGCNHMHCKQCDHHFCWVCLGPFANYSHACNKFVENAATTDTRAALQRYAHHYQRFENHAKSRELESKLRESALKNMQKLQDEGHKTLLEVQFIKDATNQLIEARQVLQWTYVTGFYAPSWLQTDIFNMNQSELEGATERLSSLLESVDDRKSDEVSKRMRAINTKLKAAIQQQEAKANGKELNMDQEAKIAAIPEMLQELDECEAKLKTMDALKWCNAEESIDMRLQTNQVKTRLKKMFEMLEGWRREESV